jgi:hypothetical protein
MLLLASSLLFPDRRRARARGAALGAERQCALFHQPMRERILFSRRYRGNYYREFPFRPLRIMEYRLKEGEDLLHPSLPRWGSVSTALRARAGSSSSGGPNR